MTELNVILHENVQVNKLYTVRITKDNIIEYLKLKGVDFGNQDLTIYLRSTDNQEICLDNDNPLHVTCYIYEQSSTEKLV